MTALTCPSISSPNTPTAPKSASGVCTLDAAFTQGFAANDPLWHRGCERLPAKRMAEPQHWKYYWNSDDQLHRVVTPDDAIWEYHYDPFGRRIGKKQIQPATTTKKWYGAREKPTNVDYLWSGNLLVEEKKRFADGTEQTVQYHYEQDSFRPLAQEVNGELQYIVTDHLGTPKELLNEKGDLLWKSRHKLWGEVIEISQWVKPENRGNTCDLRFQGQIEDQETGMFYNRHRYYDPDEGQYISPDPIGLAGGPNHYAYTKNTVRWIDPLGLSSFDPFSVGEITAFPDDLHFGQDRIAPNFSSIGSQADSSIAGRSISDVASDMKAGKISPDTFVISYTIDPVSGKPVTLNNRGLAAIVESGKQPTHAILVPYEEVPPHLVADIKTRPPSRSIAVTQNKDGTGFVRRVGDSC